MTVYEILNWSLNCLKDHQIENPRLNAEMLLAHALNLSREGLYINLKSQVRKEEKETLEGLINRRISGEPLQYILGHQEFWSIELNVDPRVLIPRPETELLVEQALLILAETPFRRLPFVLEIGTGSGAIAIALAKERRDIFLVAIDISIDALRLAKENAAFSGVLHQIHFVHGHLLDPFRFLGEEGPFDLILSNPPYIPFPEIEGLPKEVRDYEPIIALNGGEDGLAFHRTMILKAPFYLKRGGWLLLEVGHSQGKKVSRLIEKQGDFLTPQCLPDLSGIERVVKAQRRESLNVKVQMSNQKLK
jgi:release factor glutamine methyltransferase